MSETFTFDVSYGTSFEDLEKLREKMLEFVNREKRDYHPVFDVNIKGMHRSFIVSIAGLMVANIALLSPPDIPDQDKMTLSVDIKYKSNSQAGSVKCKWSF